MRVLTDPVVSYTLPPFALAVDRKALPTLRRAEHKFDSLVPHTYDQIQTGDSYSATQRITAEDVKTFAHITGDGYPLHIDENDADPSSPGPPIIPEALLLGLISKILGRDFPGPGSIAVGRSCRFLHPVPIDSKVTIEVTVADKIEQHQHINMCAEVYLGPKKVLPGEGTVIPFFESPSAAELKATDS